MDCHIREGNKLPPPYHAGWTALFSVPKRASYAGTRVIVADRLVPVRRGQHQTTTAADHSFETQVFGFRFE